MYIYIHIHYVSVYLHAYIYIHMHVDLEHIRAARVDHAFTEAHMHMHICGSGCYKTYTCKGLSGICGKSCRRGIHTGVFGSFDARHYIHACLYI